MFGAHSVPMQCVSLFLVFGNLMGLMRKIIDTTRIRTDPLPAFQGAWGVYRVAVCGFLCTCGAIGVFSHAHALAHYCTPQVGECEYHWYGVCVLLESLVYAAIAPVPCPRDLEGTTNAAQ